MDPLSYGISSQQRRSLLETPAAAGATSCLAVSRVTDPDSSLTVPDVEPRIGPVAVLTSESDDRRSSGPPRWSSPYAEWRAQSDNELLAQLRQMPNGTAEHEAICEILVTRYARLVHSCVRPYRN